jgi:hypothetical protein
VPLVLPSSRMWFAAGQDWQLQAQVWSSQSLDFPQILAPAGWVSTEQDLKVLRWQAECPVPLVLLPPPVQISVLCLLPPLSDALGHS